VFRQISANEFIYVSNFNPETKVAFNFTIEKFKGDQLESKLSVGRLRYNAKDSSYTMFNYTKRTVGSLGDKLESATKKDTVFNFDLEDLTPVVYVAETLTLGELNSFIEKE